MRHIFSLLSFLLFPLISLADTEVDSLIHNDLASLPAPLPSDAVSLYDYDIKYNSPEVYENIQQGFGHLLSLWNFQANRYFIEALREQNDSIMATSGLAISLLGSDRHMKSQQVATGKHLRKLLKTAEGTPFEKAFGTAVLELVDNDRVGWMRQLSKMQRSQDNKHLMIDLLHAYHLRDGYTTLGDPKKNQRDAIKSLTAIIEKHPNDPAALVFYSTTQMDKPRLNNKNSLGILEASKKLVQRHPEYAVYHKLYGYVSLRAGDPFKSLEAYRTGHELLSKYLSENKIPLRNGIDLINCQLGLINALLYQERYEEALAENKKLLMLKQTLNSPPALSKSVLEWEAMTFPTRIALIADDEALLKASMADLRSYLDRKEYSEKVVHYFWNALYIYAEARVMMNNNQLDNLSEKLTDYSIATSDFFDTFILAHGENATSYWKRAGNLLSILQHELVARKELTKNVPDQVIVTSNLNNAAERQQLYRGFMSPIWPVPMEITLYEFHQQQGNSTKALEFADTAYRKMPNHPKAMQALRNALEGAARPQDAEKVSLLIKQFQEKREKSISSTK